MSLIRSVRSRHGRGSDEHDTRTENNSYAPSAETLFVIFSNVARVEGAGLC
jgi:hypothetical protein